MLSLMSLTPSVMTVKRGTGGRLLIYPSSPPLRLEQAQLLSAALRFGEMIGRQFRPPLVEAEFFAGDFETPSDHPGHGTCALHPRTPLRVVVAAAAHVADQG